jgi:branched-chain amino acid transport system permease protein
MRRFLNSTALARGGWLIPIAAWVLVLLLPIGLGDTSLQRTIMLIAIYFLVTSGLNLSFGFGGELALGQIAVMAFGAYTTAILTAHGVTDVIVCLLASMVVACLVGLLTGVPGLRMSRWALGLVSFFLVLLLPGLASWSRDISGGLQGISVDFPTFFGTTIESSTSLFVLIMIVAGIWLVIFRNLVMSRYGQALRSFRESPKLIESLGHSAATMKLSAYLLGSIPAGAAGALYAYLSGFLSPSPFNLTLVLAILAATVFGGSDSIYGAVLGAAVMVYLPLQSQSFSMWSLVVYGAFLIIVGTALNHGIAGAARALIARLRGSSRPAAEHADGRPEFAPRNGGELHADGVEVAFGGVRALDGAGVTARAGEITAIIGSNGAGKTTLLNVISGFVTAARGSVTLSGTTVLGLSPATIARRGISRGFQTPLIPKGTTVVEVVAGGRLRAEPLRLVTSALRLPAFRRHRRKDLAEARTLLAAAGLAHVADVPATSVPLGIRRLLEVLRCTAGDPEIIMLDEPAAGLDDESLAALGDLLRGLRAAGATIILIEHHVPFVLGIADSVTVLERGRTLAVGTPDEIRVNADVIASYLGRSTAQGGQVAAIGIEKVTHHAE